MLKVSISGLPRVPKMSAMEFLKLRTDVENAVANVKSRFPAWQTGHTQYSYTEEKEYPNLGEKIFVEILVVGKDVPPLVQQDLTVTVGDAIHKNLPNALIAGITNWVPIPNGIYSSVDWDRTAQIVADRKSA